MYTFYKTTNLINQKIYMGVHKTNKPDDNYLGSGLMLLRAIEKYRRKNFRKEVLFVTESEEEAYKKEREIVNHDFILREDTYNLKIGGVGGSKMGRAPVFKGRHHTKETKLKCATMTGKTHSEETKRKMSENSGMKKKEIREKVSRSLTGRKLSQEHKMNVSNSLKGKKEIPILKKPERNNQKRKKEKTILILENVGCIQWKSKKILKSKKKRLTNTLVWVILRDER